MANSKLAVKEQNHDIVKAPDIVIQEAQKASAKLVEIVDRKPKKVIINNEQYLEFEDWQTLGRFYGLFVKTGEVEPVILNGIKGFKARAIVVNKEGLEVGSAESYCMRDEPNWKNKPSFQLASMAQTRAGAKALRNLLSWVAVLAGYKPTPAEEIIEIREELEKKNNSEEKNLYKQMLEKFARAKEKLGEKVYYEILGMWGVEHANQIKSIQKGEAILKQMRRAYNDMVELRKNKK